MFTKLRHFFNVFFWILDPRKKKPTSEVTPEEGGVRIGDTVILKGVIYNNMYCVPCVYVGSNKYAQIIGFNKSGCKRTSTDMIKFAISYSFYTEHYAKKQIDGYMKNWEVVVVKYP